MKLLNRSIFSYLLYAVIIIFISIPLVYFAIQEIVVEEVDEGLVAQKQEIVASYEKYRGVISIPEMSALGITLRPSKDTVQQDTFYERKVYDPVSEEKIPYRILESNVQLGDHFYSMSVKRSLIDRRELIQRIVFVMVVLLMLIVAGFLIINRRISNILWKPFYKTVNQMNSYSLESSSPPEFESSGIEEFAELNRSLTLLIKRARQSFQSQKEFTENASHEMQTPLAILQGKLELLMQTNPLNADQASLMSDLADASQRMSRLNQSLVLLSNIENSSGVATEEIRLQEAVHSIIKHFSVLADQKKISMVCDIRTGRNVRVNPSLFDILISNLISNAIRHTAEGGAVVISALEKNKLAIRNTAINGPLDTSRIFQRFHKESADPASTGLGLSIAERISAISRFSLVYSFEKEMHVFTLTF